LVKENDKKKKDEEKRSEDPQSFVQQTESFISHVPQIAYYPTTPDPNMGGMMPGYNPVMPGYGVPNAFGGFHQ
jgi:hypothetical protein